MNIFFEYFNYKIKAQGRHGTHSPFIYSLVNECLTTKIDKNFILTRKKLFRILKNSQEKINITDFGAGSKKLGNIRKVSDVFLSSSSKGKYGDLLYRLVRHYKPKNVLELGTSLGVGSLNLSQGDKSIKLTTVEGCPEVFKQAQRTFEFMQESRIDAHLATFKDFLAQYKGQKFDLVYVDGHHNGDALLNYLKLLKQFTHNDTMFVLDDIRWDESMYSAWKKIVSDEQYHVTLDFFRMGIIVPRHQQYKEHFVIDY